MKKRHSKKCRSALEVGTPPVRFGDHLTADHLFTHIADRPNTDAERCAIAVFGIATRYRGRLPSGGKTAEEAMLALQHFVGLSQSVKYCYSDNAPELMRAARNLQWCADTSTPIVVARSHALTPPHTQARTAHTAIVRLNVLSGCSVSRALGGAHVHASPHCVRARVRTPTHTMHPASVRVRAQSWPHANHSAGHVWRAMAGVDRAIM